MHQSRQMSVSRPIADGNIRDKVELLKLETVQLNQQIHKIFHDDGMKDAKIHQLESELENYKYLHGDLTRSLEQSVEKVKILKESKEELFSTVVKLNERIGQQNSLREEKYISSPRSPEVSRESKRHDTEDKWARSLHYNRTSDVDSESLTKLMSQLGKQLVEIELLRSENVSRRRSLNEPQPRFANNVGKMAELPCPISQIQKLVKAEKSNLAKIAALESDLAESRSSEAGLAKSLRKSQDSGKDLEKSVAALRSNLEIQGRLYSEVQNAWLKVPAAIRSLKRLDDETVRMRRDSTGSKEQVVNDDYAKLVGKLRRENDLLLGKIAKLTSEKESQEYVARRARNSLERLKMTSTATVATLVEKLEELRVVSALS